MSSKTKTTKRISFYSDRRVIGSGKRFSIDDGGDIVSIATFDFKPVGRIDAGSILDFKKVYDNVEIHSNGTFPEINIDGRLSIKKLVIYGSPLGNVKVISPENIDCDTLVITYPYNINCMKKIKAKNIVLNMNGYGKDRDDVFEDLKDVNAKRIRMQLSSNEISICKMNEKYDKGCSFISVMNKYDSTESKGKGYMRPYDSMKINEIWILNKKKETTKTKKKRKNDECVNVANKKQCL